MTPPQNNSISVETLFSNAQLHVFYNLPADLTKMPVNELPQPEQSLVANACTYIEWLKIAAKKNNQLFTLHINEKIVIENNKVITLQDN